MDGHREAAIIARLQRHRRGETDTSYTLDQAREDLFASYHDGLLRVAMRITGHEQKAEELANEAALVAWEKLVTGRFEGRSRLSTFMYGIVRNKAYQSVRKRTEELIEEDELFRDEAADRTALSGLTRRERLACVRAAIADLTPLEQEVVHLRYVEGLPYTTIERLVDVDVAEYKSGVRGILVRCRRKLERGLRAWLGDNGLGSSFFETMP